VLSFHAAVVTLVLVGAFTTAFAYFAIRWGNDTEILSQDADGRTILNQEVQQKRIKGGLDEAFEGLSDLLGHLDNTLQKRRSNSSARKMLHIERGATDEEITKAFRKYSKIWHPDKYRGNPVELARTSPCPMYVGHARVPRPLDAFFTALRYLARHRLFFLFFNVHRAPRRYTW